MDIIKEVGLRSRMWNVVLAKKLQRRVDIRYVAILEKANLEFNVLHFSLQQTKKKAKLAKKKLESLKKDTPDLRETFIEGLASSQQAAGFGANTSRLQQLKITENTRNAARWII